MVRIRNFALPHPTCRATYLLGLIRSKLFLTASHTMSTLLSPAALLLSGSLWYEAEYNVCVVSSSFRSARTRFRLVAESSSLTKRSMFSRKTWKYKNHLNCLLQNHTIYCCLLFKEIHLKSHWIHMNKIKKKKRLLKWEYCSCTVKVRQVDVNFSNNSSKSCCVSNIESTLHSSVWCNILVEWTYWLQFNVEKAGF